jgi:hypothetical protein
MSRVAPNALCRDQASTTALLDDVLTGVLAGVDGFRLSLDWLLAGIVDGVRPA